MPLIRPDWWLSLAAKGNALLGMAGALLAFTAFALGLWSTFHTLQTPPDDGLPVMSTLASTWLFCGCILLLGIATYVIAVRRRKHLRNTLAALHGNQDALSPAHITGHAEGAQDVTNHALKTVWPSRWFDRPVVTRFRATISFVAILALAIAIVLVFAIDVLQVGLDPRWASVSLVFSTAWLWLVGDPWRAFDDTYGIAARARANEAGIRWQSTRGSAHTMSWTELRLLELAIDRRSMQFYGAIRFTLYGARHTMKWRDTIGPNNTAIQSQQLLDVIASKTELVPLTDDKTLERLEGPSRFTSLVSSPAATIQRNKNDPQRRFGDAKYSLVWRNHSPQARLVGGLTGALLVAADAVAVLWILGAVGVRQFDGVPAALP
ncbi:MAG TPA: hypothetical protein VGS80_16795 [Ktedonobacterales bacterium]|nr:hypothetical protein [Ktedonobacterales bacterium]